MSSKLKMESDNYFCMSFVQYYNEYNKFNSTIYVYVSTI